VQRVAILATGGLSHDVGTPRMGVVDEKFDREFLHSLMQSDLGAAARYAHANVDGAGNGTEEVRTWLMAHGAAGRSRFEVLYYRAIQKWYAGIGIGQWHIDGR